MKLISTKRNFDGKQLICEDAILDSNFITVTKIDAEENVIFFRYDHSECGHPLNLPFEARAVEFILKLTSHDIHICAIAELNDDVGSEFDEYTDEVGEIEFDGRMTTEEKFNLLRSIYLLPTQNKESLA